MTSRGRLGCNRAVAKSLVDTTVAGMGISNQVVGVKL
jgi:hypothetical protein